MNEEAIVQRNYYARLAARYDAMHLDGGAEHVMALGWLTHLIRHYGYESLLDIGCGTGRCLRALKKQGLSISLKGVEPVAELRDVGIQHGLTDEEIVGGDALALSFPNASFDIVCAFGVLHHIRDHGKAVSEMCRVARHAVFISDSNNFGQGSVAARAIKHMLNAAGLWGLYDYVRTSGKGYHCSEGDGVYYSYSLFNDLPVVEVSFSRLHFMSTLPSGSNLYRSASHLAVFATGKKM